MASQFETFAHVLVRERADSRAFHRGGGGDPKIRDVERRVHGRGLAKQLDDTVAAALADRAALPVALEELQALGVVIVLEGAAGDYPLKLDSMESLSRHRKEPKRPRWLLLSVTPQHDDRPEQAIVWVSDEYRSAFLQIFTQFLGRDSETGKPWNRELVSNIARIREAVLEDLWQSSGTPPPEGRRWWEIWLAPTDSAIDEIRAFASSTEIRLAESHFVLNERTVVWAECEWSELEELPFTRVPVTEIRRPLFAETLERLDDGERNELTEVLAARVSSNADPAAPVVCHLDTGVRQSHRLVSSSLASSDVHSIVGSTSDAQNHGTAMAGLALFGPLDRLLLTTSQVELRHRLESVKILPDAGSGHDPKSYGLITAQAVALPEATVTRRRVFCLPITAPPDRDPGEPSLWSASLDALAVGVGIAADADGIALLGAPDPAASRLFVVSAGNVPYENFARDYAVGCDLAPIEDPAHAWNALTVGAFTELDATPSDPSFNGWSALAASGDISPHSRTSVLFSRRKWPVKPDICMEGGNVLHDGASDFVGDHPIVSLLSADASDDLAIGSTNATSAATAQAARLAAIAHAKYPAFWPETIRGLLIHSAEWTQAMRSQIAAAANKTQRLSLLRRYGWGVPTEEAVLNSNRQAVTMVTQDAFVPFEGDAYVSPRFRLHRLPWPVDVLRGLGGAEVALRVTLSYFIEPTASRRGWRRRYAYPSHSLRFDLKMPLETPDEFLGRVNRDARNEEEGGGSTTSPSDRWLVGPNQRTLGSLHQDVWEGTGAELAECGMLAVYPVGGWWKNSRSKERVDQQVRYALLVSLKTAAAGVDLYTPIAVQLQIPVPTPGS